MKSQLSSSGSSASYEGNTFSCEKYLEMMQSIGARVGDFYLLLGREWRVNPLADNAYPKGEAQACYKNAYLLTILHPELVYCEGYAMPAGLIPIHHAWCIDKDGHVVDTTWNDPNANYFGVALDPEFLEDHLNQSGVYGVLGECVPPNVYENSPKYFIHQDWLASEENLNLWTQLVGVQSTKQKATSRPGA